MRAAQRGLTLVELMMSLAVASAAMAMAFSGYATALDFLHVQRLVTDCQLDHAELYFELERDLKNAGADPTNAGLFNDTARVSLVSDGDPLAGGLQIQADITGASGEPDGDLDDEGELVTYHLDTSSGALSRWVSTGTGGMVGAPMSRSVNTFQIEFLDASGAAASSSAATQVRVTLESRVSYRDPRPTAPVRRDTFLITLRNT